MSKKNNLTQTEAGFLTETKSFLKSKTIQGIVITALAGIFPALGLIPDSLFAQIVDGIFLTAGAIYAAYGRIKAETVIG